MHPEVTNREKRPRQIGLLETSSTRWPPSPNAVMVSRDDDGWSPR